MDEEEHEVYGGEIPDEGEMEGDMDSQNVDIDMSRTEDDAVKVLSTAIFPPPSTAPNLWSRSLSFWTSNLTLDLRQELDEMKKRLKEMEEEAAALREMQAKVEKEMGAVQGLFLHPLIPEYRTVYTRKYLYARLISLLRLLI